MSDFKTKMHRIRFQLVICLRPYWGRLQCSTRPASWGNLL